jgi:FAD synthase
MKVVPVQKIRDEMKFDNLDDLIKQMDTDCVAAKNILQSI